MNKKTTLLLALTIVSAVAGYSLQQMLYKQPPEVPRDEILVSANIPEPDRAIIGQYRPDFSLPDITGRMHNISEWDGQVITVNFWATWCPPCLKEIPELIDLHHRYGPQGFQVIGIALQKPEELSDFMTEMGMNYTVLAGEEPVIEIAEKYGNNVGALPYTAIVDRTGVIVFVRTGPVTGTEIEAVIKDLL